MRRRRAFLISLLVAGLSIGRVLADDVLPDLLAVCVPNEKGFEPLMATHRAIAVAISESSGNRLLIPKLGDDSVDEDDLDVDGAFRTASWRVVVRHGKGLPHRNWHMQRIEGGASSTGRQDLEKFVLGPCDVTGDVIASGDFESANSRPMLSEALVDRHDRLYRLFTKDALAQGRKSRGRVLDSNGIRIDPDFRYEAATLTIDVAVHGEPLVYWGLFRRGSDEPLSTIGQYRGGSDVTRLVSQSWLKDSKGRLIGVMVYEDDGEEGGGRRVRVVSLNGDKPAEILDGTIDEIAPTSADDAGTKIEPSDAEEPRP